MTSTTTPADYLGALHGPDSFEVCAILPGREVIRIGVFNDPHKAERAACEYDGKAKGLYVTVNPTNKWAGNPVRLKPTKHRCGANDMGRRAHWYFDVDSERPKDANATEPEHTAALRRRDDLAAWIIKQGGPDPKIMGDSGNGGYLAFNLAPGMGDIKRAHDALCNQFSNPYVTLDKSVTNLDRLSPLVGTLKAKGPHTAERPRRRVGADVNTNAEDMTPEIVAYIASLWPTPPAPARADLLDYNGAQLPAAAIEFLSHPPQQGERNAGLFAAARAMRDAGLSEQQAHDTLTTAALSIGLEAGETTRTIHSPYAHASAHGDHRAALAFTDSWRAVVIDMSSTGKQTAARTRETRVALALADMAARLKKTEIGAGVRDVSIGAALSRTQTGRALMSLREAGLIVCTNEDKRDAAHARTYQLAMPGETEKAVTVGTLLQGGGEGAGETQGGRPPAKSVPTVTAFLAHEFVSTRIGTVAIQIMQAMPDHPTVEQLRKATGRRPKTIEAALQVMHRAGLIQSKKIIQRGIKADGWQLTTTDPARILQAFDHLAIQFKANGRRDALRHEYAKERDLFQRVDSDQSTADQIRESQRRNRKSSGIRAAAANMNARAMGKAHTDRVELKP